MSLAGQVSADTSSRFSAEADGHAAQGRWADATHLSAERAQGLPCSSPGTLWADPAATQPSASGTRSARAAAERTSSSRLGRSSAEEAKSLGEKSRGRDADPAAGEVTVAAAEPSSPSPAELSGGERTKAALSGSGGASEAAERAPLFWPPRRARGPRAAGPRLTLAALRPPPTAAASGEKGSQFSGGEVASQLVVERVGGRVTEVGNRRGTGIPRTRQRWTAVLGSNS